MPELWNPSSFLAKSAFLVLIDLRDEKRPLKTAAAGFELYIFVRDSCVFNAAHLA